MNDKQLQKNWVQNERKQAAVVLRYTLTNERRNVTTERENNDMRYKESRIDGRRRKAGDEER